MDPTNAEVEVVRLRATIAQLKADVHGRDLCIASLNDALELAESVLRAADATIKELQGAITTLGRAA